LFKSLFILKLYQAKSHNFLFLQFQFRKTTINSTMAAYLEELEGLGISDVCDPQQESRVPPTIVEYWVGFFTRQITPRKRSSNDK